jgi:hypothetical protein
MMQLVGFSAPPLYKFCPSKFDITKGCDTIRVGTLWGFREEENELLKDQGEGEFEFKIQFPRLTEVSNEWIAEVGTDTGGSAYIEEMTFNNGTTSIKGANLKGSAHNCWVYCVSMTDSLAGNISEVHESNWQIRAEEVQNFGTLLGSLVWNNITIDDLPSGLVKKHTLQELNAGLGLEIAMKPVDQFIS